MFGEGRLKEGTDSVAKGNADMALRYLDEMVVNEGIGPTVSSINSFNPCLFVE